MTSPLTLMMPVLPNTSLGTIIEVLEANNTDIDKALVDVGTVHFARFSLLDRSQINLQPDLTNIQKPSDTLIISVITEYDGDFNKYISDFVAQLGNVFDTLLAHVVGGSAIVPVKNNLAAFEAFITTNDASQHSPNEGLFAAYDVNVQKIIAVFPPTA